MDRLDPATGALASGTDAGTGGVTCSLDDWNALGCPLDAAVTLRGDEELAGQLPALAALSRIIIRFPVFMDGRGFSVARQLRENGFAGELLAAGDVLPDQWQLLERCGFSALLDSDLAQTASALPRISTAYQQV